MSLDQAFGYTLTGRHQVRQGWDGFGYGGGGMMGPEPYRHHYNAQAPPPQIAAQAAQAPQPQQQLGQMFGLPGHISDSQEFCNLILFIAFGIFSLYVLDSLVRLAIRKG